MTEKTVFICQNCGFSSPKWLGKCPGCGEWNSLVEEFSEGHQMDYAFQPAEPTLYEDIKEAEMKRICFGMDELNRVLGGGIVLGSLVLIGGEPGIGKSTLLLQISQELSAKEEKVLYVSGEESLEQMKLRGQRLGLGREALYLLAETNLDRILVYAEKLSPRCFVLDSVQTIFSPKLSSSPGSISQVREVANQVFRFSKKNNIPCFIIGHVTKEGSLAGPKSLEHMVDVVLSFEGERDHSHRVLRVLKNRFGPVSEIAVFEMLDKGLEVISNPSAFFLKERPKEEAGSVVSCIIKGSRPLMAEIQALVSSTLFSGNPRRMTVGLDHYRASMLLAITEKKLGFSFAGEDVYLNVAGGLVVEEPATDLGIILAVVSCLKNKAVPAELAVFGEVGLSGEIRSVSQPLLRLKEAASLGFKTVLLPEGNRSQLGKEATKGIELIGVSTLRQAIESIL